MSKELIFLIENDMNIQQFIKTNLENYGYRVLTFDSGESLLDKCESSTPDLFLLDVMLPGIDGFEVCRRLRRNNHTKPVPIIITSTKGDEMDRVLGLEIGADDYITIPFSERELIARIRSILRRINTPYSDAYQNIRFGNITMNLEDHKVYKNGKLIEMTLIEFDIMKMLVLNKGRTILRQRIQESVWGKNSAKASKKVYVYIRHLRRKIEDNISTVCIETIRGIGYRLNDKS